MRSQKTFCACSQTEAPILCLPSARRHVFILVSFIKVWTMKRVKPNPFPPITLATSPHVQHPPSHN